MAPHVVQALGPGHERSGHVTTSTEPLGHETVRLHFSASKLVESHCEAYDGNNQRNISLLLCTGQHWPFGKMITKTMHLLVTSAKVLRHPGLRSLEG